MEFVDVPGYETYFKVSSCGKVFSKRTNRVLKTHITKKGYEVFSTRLAGRAGPASLLRVHRLVALTYIDNPENKPYVNHIDSNPLNNNVENLEWCTHRENTNHARANNRYPGLSGYKNPKGLTKEQVDWIREKHVSGHKLYGGRGLSRVSGIPYYTINDVARNKTYK